MSFPKELIEKSQWVCWRLIPGKDSGKDRKLPINPKTGKAASANNPDTWSDYNTACNALEKYKYTGLGFVFTKDDDFVGVDIDHCYDKKTGKFNDTAAAILKRQPTYAEFSPSGTGIHLFFKGSMPEGNKNTKTGVEMYCHARYFTMTGNKLQDTVETIAEGNETLQWIHENFIKPPKKKAKRKSKKTASISMTDDELLDKAQKANDAELFSALWSGKWQEQYASQSEADLALCCKLAFWSGKDKEQIDRLFRMSALYREKWDKRHHASGATYGEETISRAVEATEDIYAPGNDAPVFEHQGRYFRAKGDSIYPITNFIIRPVEMIVSEDETQLTADLVTINGETFRQSFMTTDFNSGQKFKGILNRKTISLVYLGSDGDLELLKGYLSQLEWQVKTGVKAIGIYEHDKKLVFVSDAKSITQGDVPINDIIQLERYKVIISNILDAKMLGKDDLLKLGSWLTSYNEPAKAISILAWAAGCFVKPHLRISGIKFPHLFLVGEAGSGKSNTLERVILPILCRTKIVAATQVTAFTLMKESASSNLIPQALDEFKPSKIARVRLDVLYNHFRDTYDGHEGIRGRADQSSVSYELLAPLVVAGEESADEAAVRERSIELLFSKKDINNGTCKAAFNNICCYESLLNNFGRSLLDTALGTKVSDVSNWHEEGLNKATLSMPSRILNNIACCYTGLKLVEKMCESMDLRFQDVFGYSLDKCYEFITYGAKEFLLDGNLHNKTIVEQSFEIMSRMNLMPDTHYGFEQDDTVLCLRLNIIYDLYTKYRRDYAITGEVLTYSQFCKQLRHSDFYIEHNKSKRMGGDVSKVWMLDYSMLKTHCDVSGFEKNTAKPL